MLYKSYENWHSGLYTFYGFYASFNMNVLLKCLLCCLAKLPIKEWLIAGLVWLTISHYERMVCNGISMVDIAKWLNGCMMTQDKNGRIEKMAEPIWEGRLYILYRVYM
jgi:hypothetical protein